VERQRRGVPDGKPDGNRRCWGNMVWRLNDSWPIIYWAVIDYYLEPKIPFYYLRRAYDPVLVSFERTDDEIFAWISNDSPETVSGRLTVARERFDGKIIGRLQKDVTLNPGQAKRCFSLEELGPIVKRQEFLRAAFAGREVTQLLHPERYLVLPAAVLAVKMLDKNRIEIASDNFALDVTITSDSAEPAVFEDNYFDMPPNQKRTISVIDAADTQYLTVQSLNSEPVTIRIK